MKMIVKEPKKKTIVREQKSEGVDTSKLSGKGNILKYFGSNPREKDGLAYQIKIRKEWH